jgi:hypothetical protein
MHTASSPSASRSKFWPSRSSARVALHLVVDRRHRQAALFVHRHLGAARDQFGVDQHQRLVARFRDIDHDHALVHVDLRRREADAVGVEHRLEHVVDEAPDAVVDLRHGRGHAVQAVVGITQDVQQGHRSSRESRDG